MRPARAAPEGLPLSSVPLDFAIKPGGYVLHICRFALMIVLALFALPALAYIDPNTGGFLFQLLAPLVAIAISAWMFFSNQVKAIWRLLRSAFSQKIDQKK